MPIGDNKMEMWKKRKMSIKKTTDKTDQEGED